ncbi:hypothetical protein M413DRAFT_442675 [Hebeloma cylindrosporum]|uniref:Uncharacterized protein n=1 Tax=Hebeloma cylindrosporum TaxID=76867 RepID=A0A0C3C791_HEBCY|nr:hypothetical protein M413DRAFT_442675 [Hebeloma cylindrosporum h7]
MPMSFLATARHSFLYKVIFAPLQIIRRISATHRNVHVLAMKHMITAGDVHKFLLDTPFQRYELARPGSRTTPVYTSRGDALDADHNLFYMVQDKALPGKMYQGLKSSYLPSFDNLVEPNLFLVAKMRYRSLGEVTLPGNSVGSLCASIITNRRLDIGDYLVQSLGGNCCAHRLQVREKGISAKLAFHLLPASARMIELARLCLLRSFADSALRKISS